MVVKSDIVDALPATKRPPNGFKRFRILCEIADRVVEEHERLCAMRRSLWQRRRRPSDEPLPDVEDAQLAQWVMDDIARCRALLEEIDREDHYEEDEEGDRVLQKRDRRRAPRARDRQRACRREVGGRRRWFRRDACGARLRCGARLSWCLRMACRDIEATQKYVPATAEVLEKIDEHRGRWIDATTRNRHDRDDVARIAERNPPSAREIRSGES